MITVNDYPEHAADAAWMARLGTTSSRSQQAGINLSQMDHDSKQSAYAADITYGTK